MESAAAYLLNGQNPDGGWGYTTGNDSFVEPTALAILALQDIPQVAAACQAGAAWLVDNQNPDGGWGIHRQDQQSGWQTAWAVQALAFFPDSAAARQKGIDWLIRFEPFQITDAAQLEIGQKVATIDFSLRGWPWLPGEASWIEPTALAIWTLSREAAAEENRARLEEAVRYILDRRCAGGGWNVGNPVMFDASLPPRAQPTAWTLLALRRFAPQVILAEDLRAMQADMEADGGAMARAWCLLALRALDAADDGQRASLIDLQSEEGSWGESLYQTAIAVIALQEGPL